MSIRCKLGLHDLVLACDGKHDWVYCSRCGLRTPKFPHNDNAWAKDLWKRGVKEKTLLF